MPTVKGKGGSPMSPRYRPASQYDDATLAQKREYWRTKKREQRARLSERRGKPTPDSPEKLNAPTLGNSSLHDSFALQGSDESYKNVCPTSWSGNAAATMEDSSVEAAKSSKETWLQTMELNQVLPQLPALCSVSAGDAATVKCLKTRGAGSRTITSPTPSGTQLNTSSSVPPVRVTAITNGSSPKTTPQPCVSMQGASVPKTQHKAQVTSRIQPKHLPANVTAGVVLGSPPGGPVSIKTENKAANATPRIGIKSALVTVQAAKGVGSAQPLPESEEERAARRREHWRLKKREQRAKMAAQVAKAKGRTQSTQIMLERPTEQETGLLDSSVLPHLPSQPFFRGTGHKQWPVQSKSSFTSTRRGNFKLGGTVVNAPRGNQQAGQMREQSPRGYKPVQTAFISDVGAEKKPGESFRKLQSYTHLSNVTRGIARCKTPRQRFIDAQRNFMNQRNTRGRSLSLSSLFCSRNIPKIDPNDTPEQIIAKRREYWRIKKREQRAKLSMETKDRLKEKDSLMRRVKRYQRILEEMRRARALAQTGGSTLTHASETIGGFIKEDGTVTINIPQISMDQIGSEDAASNNAPITQPQHQPVAAKRIGITSVCVKQPPPLHPPQVKVSFPLARQSVTRSQRLLSIRPRPQLQSTTATVPKPRAHAAQAVGQLKLTQAQTLQNAVAGGPAAEGNIGGCVMKMAVSNSPPSLSGLTFDPGMTEEERMAKKREYWRVKKREQRAARAARLKQGVLQARVSAALQRRKARGQVAVSAGPPEQTENGKSFSANSVPACPHASEIKQETDSVPAVDLNSQPEQAICPYIKPPASPPPPALLPLPGPQPEPDPAMSADSQATTLLAVASMKKLLEESLSTVTDCNSEQTDIKTEAMEEFLEEELKPNLPQLFLDSNDMAPISADLTLQIKSWQEDPDTLAEAGSPIPHLKDSPQFTETPPPLSTSDGIVLHPTCESSSQTASTFIVNPAAETCDGLSSPHRILRAHSKTEDLQNHSSPEPPKLHHLPIDRTQPQQQHCEIRCQVQTENRDDDSGGSSSAPAQRLDASGQSGLTSLQKKREYWKLMKRQQRARSKARQNNRAAECSQRIHHKNIQAPGLVLIDTDEGVNRAAGALVQPRRTVTSLTARTSIPTLLVVNPTMSGADGSPNTLRVNPPVTSASRLPHAEDFENFGPSQITCGFASPPENQPQTVTMSRRSTSRTSRGIDVDSAASLPTLMPPDNPLSSINLQPFEPQGQILNPGLSLLSVPQSHKHSTPLPPVKLAPLTTMVPPKLLPGESEEEFLRRKREYWRIKKKEQRARKAIRDKGNAPKRTANNWRPILPVQDPQPDPQVTAAQDSGQWANSSEESEDLLSNSVDTEQAPFQYSDYLAPVEDESDLLLPDYEHANGEEGCVEEAVWRNRYLMDYDPLNLLLVCMVCGEPQYSHSEEGVAAHIDEAHPETLDLEPAERQRILEAWDEQVSQRERFFTSQLQQHGAAGGEADVD